VNALEIDQQELEAAAELMEFLKKFVEEYKPLFKGTDLFEIRLSPSEKANFNYKVHLQVEIPHKSSRIHLHT
jgi:hypothetical protein